MPTAEASLRALVLRVALLLPQANQAFARWALGQHERAVSFMAALATKGAKCRQSAQGSLQAATPGSACAEMAALLRATGTLHQPQSARRGVPLHVPRISFTAIPVLWVRDG